ncbi:GGDEF domain-containing response regulator [Corallococcus carmarthensis]|uniref:Diguanylate cyclase n=1 Tax=Corallococcus carmarthensis TaxID=2316728 RepID=A0A3A8K7A5_9BACT|nr:diguanylate cyclase [Corallococcus carmarthensis]NOK18336.1 diguanylate cyclase [Corallococcus carmarthensis]RKH03069.1 diguanylate cyclase [Corallococcus carmarthensis]
MPRYALIAEPDRHRAAGLLALAQQEGLEGTVARDGAEAQELVRQRGAPTLLVTDLALPRVDGFALLAWLRGRPDASGTAVMVVTAFDELRVRAWQLKDALGIHALLSRRAGPEAMRDGVRRALAGQLAGSGSMEPNADEEKRRLARIDELRLVDPGVPDQELQELVSEVAQAFGVPVALLTLVLGDRQWFKAHVGLPAALAKDRGTPRDWSFCHHVVQGREAMVVPDATRHPVFRDNPLVRDGIVGSYAGAPLITSTGEVLGSLCVIDTRPLMLGTEDLAALRELAGRVAEDLEHSTAHGRLRPAMPRPRSAPEPVLTEAAALALVREAVSALDVPVLVVAPGRKPFAANAALAELLGLPEERLSGMAFDSLCQHIANLTADPGGTLRQLDLAAESSRGLHLTLSLERPRPRVVRWVARPFLVPGGVAQMLSLMDLSIGSDLVGNRERLLRQDALTGLDTRRVGEERLAKEIGRCRREGLPVSLVLVDLVELGTLNRTRGYDAGDGALRELARRAESLCLAPGFAVRWTGDTFLLALPGADAVGAEAVRQQLHDLPGQPACVSIAVTVQGEEDPHGTLARAHAALVRAKPERKAAPPHD